MTQWLFIYYHGGIYIFHPRFPQKYTTRCVQGENIQNSHHGCVFYPNQNHPFYYYYYYYTSMTPHPHPRISPQTYPSMPTHTILLCSYCTSTPIFAPYGVPHHPHIPSLVYLCQSTPSILTYSTYPNILSPDKRPH